MFNDIPRILICWLTRCVRNLLSVDPKNLDADAELRRFFGSKVVSTNPITFTIADFNYHYRLPQQLNPINVALASYLSFATQYPNPNPSIRQRHRFPDLWCEKCWMKRWTSSIGDEGVSNWIKAKSGLRLSMLVSGEKSRGSSWEPSSLMVSDIWFVGARSSLTEL